MAKENGESVIIELLQMESTVMGNDVAEYYFNDLAKANGCEKESIQILHQLPLPKSCPILLRYMQKKKEFVSLNKIYTCIVHQLHYPWL